MKHQKKKSETKVKNVRKDYAGAEASPYNEWLQERGDYNQEHQALEPIQANPDVLAMEDTIYHHKAFLDEGQIKAVEQGWKHLTAKQQEALTLVGLEGKTLEHAGIIMKINKANVLDLIKRARKIIKKHNNL